jgi:predicted ArsR family transcriptional regulator
MLAGTRGKILARLCEANATAVDLAQQFGISANAIRLHLRALEEHGLVGYRVVRRGVGKPTHLYELSADAGRLMSRAYIPVLHHLLSTWQRRVDAGEMLEVLQQAGRALANTQIPAAATLARRAAAAVQALEALGGIVRTERHDGTWSVHATCCPLGSLTPEHPELCKLMESTLAAVTRGPVRERCQRGERPLCAFDIRSAPISQSRGRLRRK